MPPLDCFGITLPGGGGDRSSQLLVQRGMVSVSLRAGHTLMGAGESTGATLAWPGQPTRLESPAPRDPQVGRELWSRSRLRVVLRVVDELNGDHFRCPDERTTGSFLGHDFDPIAQCRRASGPEFPHPLIGVAVTEQQIVVLCIRERDDHLHSREGYAP